MNKRDLRVIFFLALLSWQAPDGHVVPWDTGLVDRFYQQRDSRLFWFAAGERAAAGRGQLLRFIDSAAWFGLDSNDYHPDSLRQIEAEMRVVGREEMLMKADRRFTEAAFGLAADCRRGRIDGILSYDGVSPVFARREDSFLLAGLRAIAPDGIDSWLRTLGPATPRYEALSEALCRSIDSGDTRRTPRISATLNIYRFVHHFAFDRFIVVNVPAAMLYYFSADTLTLQMRVVAGQPSKRTPRFAAWCNGLVLYPFWNVPKRIAVREFLPLLKRSPGLASQPDFQLLDARGRIVDGTRIDWTKVRAGDFPYTIRQIPGCENALGVLKFELTDPFDVYMHDTNFKQAFGAANRYLSHGCIRLEQAARLGDLLLDHRLDTSFLASCLRDQRPRQVALSRPVPVFVVYLTAVGDSSGGVHTYKDIYHLFD